MRSFTYSGATDPGPFSTSVEIIEVLSEAELNDPNAPIKNISVVFVDAHVEVVPCDELQNITPEEIDEVTRIASEFLGTKLVKFDVKSLVQARLRLIGALKCPECGGNLDPTDQSDECLDCGFDVKKDLEATPELNQETKQ